MTTSTAALPPLPYEEWREAKDTLHLWAQIVGKIRLASVPSRNHWWHVPLYVGVHGFTTHLMRQADVGFQIDFDVVEHRLVITTTRGAKHSFPLHDGLSVRSFQVQLWEALDSLGIEVPIRNEPFGVPMTTPFDQDTEHASYSPQHIYRFWQILYWAEEVFNEFAGWFCGKASPVHLFWHSLDLAYSRFSGRRAPPQSADPVTVEAYSHEVISFGFWAGDEASPATAFYSYTAPEPSDLTSCELHPDAAHWNDAPNGHLAHLGYDDLRALRDPRAALLAFLQSAYEAGAHTAGWDSANLLSNWCPSPAELSRLKES
jgi:hypothetical protein